MGRVAPSLPRRPGGEIARQTRKLRAGRPVSRARAVSEITRYIRRSRENWNCSGGRRERGRKPRTAAIPWSSEVSFETWYGWYLADPALNCLTRILKTGSNIQCWIAPRISTAEFCRGLLYFLCDNNGSENKSLRELKCWIPAPSDSWGCLYLRLVTKLCGKWQYFENLWKMSRYPTFADFQIVFTWFHWNFKSHWIGYWVEAQQMF